MGTYHQLTEHQRYQIYALKKAGHDQQGHLSRLLWHDFGTYVYILQ